MTIKLELPTRTIFIIMVYKIALGSISSSSIVYIRDYIPTVKPKMPIVSALQK